MRVPRPQTGKNIPIVLWIAHHGTISLSVLENIITPRAPCSSLAPDKLPAWLSLGCGVGAPLAGCQGFKKTLGAKVASWYQSTFIVKPNSEKKKIKRNHPSLLSPLHRASWHTRNIYAGTLSLILGASFCFEMAWRRGLFAIWLLM